jgi:hypothetical protein
VPKLNTKVEPELEIIEVNSITKQPKGRKIIILVLEVPGSSKKDQLRIAQLVRDKETRTEGTSFYTAGNGGSLMIGSDAAKGVSLSEELIVSSCILMLKK